MEYKYIDIHSHLHFDKYDSDRAEVLERMQSQGVATISIGIDAETSEREVELASAVPYIFSCVGIHPGDSQERFQDRRDVFDRLVRSERVVAVGECGLDYFRLAEDEAAAKRRQLENFESQIAFAVEHDLPLMIHTRDAMSETIDVLESKKSEYGDKLRGNAHFFTGSVAAAKRLLAIDFTVSFTGVVTFARDYDEVIRYLPQNMLHAETDAPFVAPVPYRGQRNEPTYVKEVVKALSAIRGEEEEDLRRTLLANARRLFAIDL